MMKESLRYKIYQCKVWALFAFIPIASFGVQTPTKNIHKPPMWIIDGYALHDSVFQYSISEMHSDSAAMLVERSLPYISAQDIKSIKCIEDSVLTVNITTDKNIPILIILNGEEYKNEVTLPVGKVLAGENWIQEIIRSEIPYLDEYGIEKTIVLHEDSKQLLFDYPPKGAVLIITTQKPYNKVGAMLKHAIPNLNIKPHKEKGGKQ